MNFIVCLAKLYNLVWLLLPKNKIMTKSYNQNSPSVSKVTSLIAITVDIPLDLTWLLKIG